MTKSKETRVCPRCGESYREYPALSRKDNKTEICPQCGIAEALEAAGLIRKEGRDESKL